MVSVTAFFAGILAFFYIFLSFKVIRRRRWVKAAIGDGSDEILKRRIRVHGNFAEYVPFALVLMLINELMGQPKWVVILAGVLLTAGRLAHMHSLLVTEVRETYDVRFRQAGMFLTFTTLIMLGASSLFIGM